MNKILASDYDDTLFVNGAVDEAVKRLLKEWRQEGNLFGLVTGRDRLMSRDALAEQNIQADFLVCNNGTVLVGPDYQILQYESIPLSVIQALIQSPLLRASSYIVLADPLGRYIYGDDFHSTDQEGVYHTELLDRDSILSHPFFYQMDTRYPNVEIMRQIGEALEAAFGGVVTVNRNVTTIDLSPPGVTKAVGLARYLRIKGWEDREVITVGDGLNDLPMIQRYQGYTMEWAAEGIKAKAPKGVVRSVAEIIEREL